MVEVKTLVMEFLRMLTKRRVQKAEQNIEVQNAEEMRPPTPNLVDYLKMRESEEVPFGAIQNRVETTAKKATGVKGTDTRPQS